MGSKYQVTATFTHSDGAIMTYDILGIQHLTTNQIPIVLIGGMNCLRIDWEHLANALSTVRPGDSQLLVMNAIHPILSVYSVLLLDHRGMGDSTYSPPGDEKISIESYARDILDLLIHLQWEKIALCGFSMGGAIVQQILLLPYHIINPTAPHPFTITHVFLTGTFTSPIRQKDVFSKFISIADEAQMTKEGKKEKARPGLELCFDDAWLADLKNRERFDLLLERIIVGRPVKTILQQGRAVGSLNFNAPQSLISPKIPILVIHGENDQIIPFSSSREILSLIPHAQFVSVGPNRGQVPNLKFGHQWFEYFDAQVWAGVFESFMEVGSKVETKL